MYKIFKEKIKQIKNNISSQYKKSNISNVDFTIHTDSSLADIKFEKFMEYPKSSTEIRINKLKNSNKKNVIYVYDQLDFSTFRYRALNLLEIYKNYFTDITAHVFFLNEIPEIYKHKNKIDLLVLVRTSWTPEIENLVLELKNTKRKIIYDIDDLIIDEEHIRNVVRNDYQAKDNNHITTLFGVILRKVWLMRLADYFITPNEFLGKKIQQYYQKRTYLIYNSLNKTQIDYANYLSNNKTEKENSIKYLAYFSGSSSHNADFASIKQVLLRILKERNDVHLLIGGFLQLDDVFNKYSERIVRVPFTNFVSQLNYINQCYINLIPLEDNEFNDCKSELKYFESAILYKPSIASLRYPFRKIKERNSNNILLANSENEWYENIRLLLDKEETYERISKQAHKDAINTYYDKNIYLQLKQVLDDVLN